MSGMGYVSLPALFSLLVHWQLISSLLWDFLASTQDICCWFHLSLQCGTHQRNYSEIKRQMKNILENHLHIKDIVKHNREPRCWAETVWTLLTEWQCILHSVPQYKCTLICTLICKRTTKNASFIYIFKLCRLGSSICWEQDFKAVMV